MEKHAPAARPFGFGDGRLSAGLIVLITLLLVTMLATTAGAAATGTAAIRDEDTLLRCLPGELAGVVGQPLDFDIYVEDVVDLWAGDVQMEFDPAMVQIIDADPDAEGIQIEILDAFLTANFVLYKNGDNDAGTIRYAATHLNAMGSHQPASGSGALARVTFDPLQAGSFVMSFTYHLLNDVDGFEIEATAVDCAVTVIEAPDPGTTTYMPLVFPGIKEPPPFRD